MIILLTGLQVMLFVGFFALVLPGQGAPDLTVEQFKEQYRQGIADTLARYQDIHLRETKVLVRGTKSMREAFVTGKYIKIGGVEGGRWVTVLSPQNFMSLRYDNSKQAWTLHEYTKITNDDSYREQRAIIEARLPEAFKHPFRIDQRQPLLDALEGKFREAPVGSGGVLKVSDKAPVETKIEVAGVRTLRTGNFNRYRVDFNFLNDNQVVSTAYAEVDPALGWQVTRGGSHALRASMGRAWTIEYGDKINGVPIMKKHTLHLRVSYDPKTGAESVNPDDRPITVTVDVAEPCTTVDSAEFTPDNYNVEPPVFFDPNQPKETPSSLYWALAGVVAFFGLILLLAYRRSSPRAGTTTPSAP